MKYLTYLTDSGPVVGVVVDGGTGDGAKVVPLGASDRPVTDLLEVIRAGAPAAAAHTTGVPVELADLRLLAPIPRPPRNVLCVGQNYRRHSQEFDASGYNSTPSDGVPSRPVVFTKATTTVTGPTEDVPLHSALTAELDYEAELGVVIGTGGRAIPAASAMDHVWGYTLINDVTARDVQRDHRQWFLGKSLDGSCPMGPFLVTADEVDHRTLVLECRVNGELRQVGACADLIFDIPELIATLSAGMTLEPGDVIATGTPAGVGIGFDPPRFLRDGDVVEIAAAGLGVLRNRIVADRPRTTEGTT